MPAFLPELRINSPKYRVGNYCILFYLCTVKSYLKFRFFHSRECEKVNF